jgi:5-formyltetrahydrofolate cyclo-ligase
LSAPGDIPSAKALLRQRVSAALAPLSPGLLARRSQAVREKLEGMSVWKQACSVLLYAPLPGEVDIWPLAQTALLQGKILALPAFNRKTRDYDVRCVSDLQQDVVAGHFGIREPSEGRPPPPSKVLDLTLVPGVAFDLSGRRLGRGRGYYDRLLAAWRGLSCGVCFDEQVFESLPVEPHDIQLNCILTPTRFFQPDRH